MASVKFIAASEASLLTMSTPLFAFVLGYLVFGTTPLGHEIVGGLIIMAGVLVPLWPKDWQRRQGR